MDIFHRNVPYTHGERWRGVAKHMQVLKFSSNLIITCGLFSAAAMNCSELYARGLEDNTYVTIDADGLGSNQPFTAYCQLNGSTAYTIIRTSLYLFMNLRCILSS